MVTIMTLAIAIILFLIIKDRTKIKWISLIYTIIAIYLCRNVFVARAQIFSFLLFMLEFLCIEKLLETNKNRYIVFLLIIPILIANLHSSVFPSYFIIYLPYIAEFMICVFKEKVLAKSNNKFWKIINKVLNKFKIEKKENIRKLFLVAFIAIFTGMLSTAGFAPYTDMIKAMSGESTSFIGELEPSTIYNNPSFYFIIISIINLVIFTKIKPKITDIFFILGFGVMTISTYRCIYFFLLIGAVPIVRTIMNYIDEYNVKIENKYFKIILIILFIFSITITYAMTIISNQLKEYVPEKTYPVAACDWILENIDINEMKIFNNFNYGSYMEYRGIKAFIDSRSGMFCEEFNEGTTILLDWLETKNNPEKCEEIFKEYGITHILIRNEDEQFEILKESENWKVVYQDKYFTLFEKNI